MARKPKVEVAPVARTLVTEVVLPVRLVALEHLRTADGPVYVQCEGINELVMLDVLKGLPGGKPKAVGEAGERPTDDALEQVRIMNQYAPMLIESGTTLAGPDGEVRPAFYFDDARPHHPLSIPGRLLRESDKVLIVGAIMELSGYGTANEEGAEGGSADAAVFPEGRGGAGNGVGAVEAGAGDGDAAAPADAEAAHAGTGSSV